MPPLLAVEVRFASTGWLDQGRKRSLYEEHGVAPYWLVDPAAPSITVLELRDGGCVEVATARGDETISMWLPVPLELTPSSLARG